jgi:hypothetical protein
MIFNGTADGSKIIGPLRGQPPRGYVERRDPGFSSTGGPGFALPKQGGRPEERPESVTDAHR